LIAMSCGGAIPARTATPPPAPAKVVATVHHLQDPDLDPPRPKKLLAIDWAATPLANDADALALWQRIAPTSDDWEEKLSEIPTDGPIADRLAIALLREGNFTCTPPPRTTTCGPLPAVDVPEPAPAATLADPCLRRMLAMWAIEQLDEEDVPSVRDALRAIAAIPPPESQLIAVAVRAIPETDFDGRYDLLAIAWRAGQHELVNGLLFWLDEPHLAQAVTQLHADRPLAHLAATIERPLFLAAVADDQIAPNGRIDAIHELVAEVDGESDPDPKAAPKLPADLRKALLAAGKATDCAVVATAARALDQHGDRTLVPKVPRTRSPAAMMRGLCVLASFERLQRSDEPSYFPTYLPTRGLEMVQVSYDPYSDADPDGDGDIHTEHQRRILKPDEAVLPEIDDLEHAMRHCQGTACRSDDHEFRFTFQPGAGGLLLSKLEMVDLPPCR
jgi:hypothetical protein